MSIIEVQSTRSQNSTTQSQGRDRFEDKSTDRKSLTPFYFGFSLAALMLYLKGSSSSQAVANHVPEGNAFPEEQPTGLDSHGALGANGDDFYLADEVFDLGSFDPSNAFPRRSSGYVFNPVDPPRKPESLNLGYSTPEVSLHMSFGKPVGFLALSNNDNGLRSAGGSSTSGDATVNRPNTNTPDDDDDDEEEEDTDGGTDVRRNTAPKVSGPVFLNDQFACTAVLIAVADLLSNASDADAGDLLSVKDVKINGVLLEQMNGQYLYHGEVLGPVLITYEVTDGELSVAATASFDLLAKPPILGTPGDDILLGTECNDEFIAGDGNDRIDGYGGNDVIYAGCGNDHIVGGSGNDVIFGDGGHDIIFGGLGDDMLSGGFGNDRLFGGSGNDILQGDAGHDGLFGDDGDDVLAGGKGRDWLHDGYGIDHVDGETGNDTVFAAADSSSDLFNGGAGTDRLSYAEHTSDLIFDLSQGSVTSDAVVYDQFANFEIFEGGTGSDVFRAILPETATPVSKTFIGGEGEDKLDYNGASQSISVDLARGTATGAEPGVDYFDSIEHFATGAGDDTFVAAGVAPALTMAILEELDDAEGSECAEEEAVAAASTNQVYTAIASTGLLHAAADQHLDGGEGHDTLDYSAAERGVIVDVANGTATGEDIGTDVFTGIEEFIGGAGDDTFIVGEGEVTLDGQSGNDMFQFLISTTLDTEQHSKHEIKGFEVGDWVRMSKYDIFDKAIDAVEDAFEDFMGDDNSGAINDAEQDVVVPIRIRHEIADEVQLTFIDADFDQNGSYEMTIQIDGEHNLKIVENQFT